MDQNNNIEECEDNDCSGCPWCDLAQMEAERAKMDRLYEEARERSRVRAEAYWKNPPPPLTPEQQRERDKSRREFAKWSRCRLEDVVWHGPDNCWTFR